MTDFWALAARDWPMAHPTHQLITAIGASCVASLLASGVLREEAIRPWGTVPCSECRRDARVIYEAAGAVAVCTGDFECPDEYLGPAPSRAAMDVEDFARRLAAAFGLDGTPGREGVVVQLGRRRLGNEFVAFDLCAHPNERGALEAVARAAHRGPAVRVMLVPDSRRLRADMPNELAGVELLWVGLDEVVSFDGKLRVDLRPILARRVFSGVLVEGPFDGLHLDANGAHWCGRELLGMERAQAITLLRALGARPGLFLTRPELWLALWPEDHTRTGALARGENPDVFDKRLRLVVVEIRAALRSAGVESILQNQRGKGGGYRLVLQADQIRLG